MTSARHTASFRDVGLGAPPMEAMVGPRAVPGAQVAEFARVFDLAGTPDRCLNCSEATDASASTQASAAMRARCGRENWLSFARLKIHCPSSRYATLSFRIESAH